MTSEERDAGEAKGYKGLAIGTVITVAIGFGIAYGIYAGDSKFYDTKLALIKSWDLQWAYLSAFLFFRVVSFLNTYQTSCKSRVMRGSDGNLRANMYIYKQINGSGLPVVFDDGPDTGKYNRANRSLHHFTENMAPVCMAMILATLVFPKPTFVVMLFYCLGRMLHQVGYTQKGYGMQGHAPGFILQAFAMGTLEGMMLMVCIKAF
jgi:hypothetical protein